MQRNLFSLVAFLMLLACSNGNTQTESKLPTSSKAKEFADFIQSHPEAQLIDVRTPEEFKSGYISGALNLDYNGSDYPRQVAALDKNKLVLIYCLSGGRSSAAAKELRRSGFSDVIELDGGILQWNKAQLPLVHSTEKQNGMSLDEFQRSIQTPEIHLIDFYAPWCAPCKKMAPIIAEIEKQYQGKVIVHRLNIDEQPTISQHYKIETLPTFKIFISGKETWSYEGIIEKGTLEQQLKP